MNSKILKSFPKEISSIIHEINSSTDGAVEVFKQIDDSRIKTFNSVFNSLDTKKLDRKLLLKCFLEIASYSNNLATDYKKKRNYPLFDFMTDIVKLMEVELIEHININNKTNNFLIHFIVECCKIMHGQTLLEKMKNIIDILVSKDQIDIFNHLVSISMISTYPVYQFWEKYLKIENDNSILVRESFGNTILSLAASNSDDRLFKNMIKKLMTSKDQVILSSKKSTVKNMIENIFAGHIPTKYSLRRLKLLYDYKFNLVPFNGFIMSQSRNLEEFKKLKKYYYNNCRIESASKFIISTINSNLNLSGKREKIIKLMSHVKTIEEKYIILVDLIHLHSYDYDINLDIRYQRFDIISKGILQKIIERTLYKSYEDEEYNDVDVYKCMRNVLSIISKDVKYRDLIIKFATAQISIEDSHFTNLFLRFLKLAVIPINFIPIKDHIIRRGESFSIYKFKVAERIISMNKGLFFIRCSIRRIKRKSFNSKRAKTLKIMNEIENYKPCLKKNVLRRGSRNYMLQKNKFTFFNKVPPISLFPGDIYHLQNQDILVKEKADGWLADVFPRDIYPNPNILREVDFKAECIEIEYSNGSYQYLYLVFDYSDNNLNILKRYQSLRKIHPYINSDTVEQIVSIDDFMTKINKERSKLMEFLSKNRDKEKLWYPKASWILNSKYSTISFWREIINHYVLENSGFSKVLCTNGPYNCDGLIITPLSGEREIKIKPIRLHTIDLLYDGTNWLDRNKVVWNVYNNDNLNLGRNKIWRCYLIENKWVAKEFRCDKTKPNPFKVASSIERLAKINWNNLSNNTYYQHSARRISRKFILLFKKQQRHLIKMFNNIKIEFRSQWLDLGSGHGKLIHQISNFNPIYYLGLDNDLVALSKARSIIKNRDWINFLPATLNENWNRHPMLWGEFPQIKFKYIVANFSLPHYYGDTFWSELNKYSESGSIFWCNFINEKGKEGYQNEECYIKTKDQKTEMFFPWCHLKPVTEQFISFEKFQKDTLKYNWKITNKFTPAGSELDSFYDWYVLVRK